MTGMANVIPLQPYRAWRERVRAVEEAVAAAIELRERELATGVANLPPRLRVVK
jgi:hypothetical protein